ncbi:MAG: DMT family transporter [Alphaproteobacteria bacterium]|nr:DMT family transporter [Alphaproteobacteria bacterium]
MNNRPRGILLVLAATLCWSTEGLWVRLVAADDWQILFWSGGLMAVALGIWLGFAHRGRIVRAVLDTGWPGLVAAGSLTLAYSGYIFALNRTTVANTYVLLATAPLFSALLGRIHLGERLRRRTFVAMVLAFGGVATMVSDSLGGGQLLGDLFALSTGLFFAVNIVALRSAPLRDGRPVDMMPSNAMAGLVIAGLTMLVTDPFDVHGGDIPYLMLIGLLSMALGTWLFTRGVRFVQSAEAGLLCLTEVVLGPLLVWAVLSEMPTPQALLGAAVVLAALVYDTLPERRAPDGRVS